ncbi:WD40 repeat-like protein [Phlebopus sp. FC_14]|nr:WD40 repeat-like protein [Phlebopus sp. FC_14]
MSDSFFASRKSKKRKRSVTSGDATQGKAKKALHKEGPTRNGKVNGLETKRRKRAADEELDSDKTDEGEGGIDDLDLRAHVEPETSGDEDAEETPAQKRLRLAKLYLESVEEGLAEGEFDAAEVDKELISARLRQDVLEHSGKVHLFIADSFDFTPTARLRCKGHRLSITSAIASEDARWLFTASKDGVINKWDLKTGAKVFTFHKRRPDPTAKGKEKASPLDIEGHTDEILTLAVSSDGQFLASGGKDRKLGVWNVEKNQWVKGFGGHRDLISSLAFRKGTLQIYTGSFDRTVKLYDLSVMGYVETLFGHQDTIVSLDALRGETAVTAGARDRTLRYWKIPEESQLVFRGGAKSAIRELLEGGAFEGHEDEVDSLHVDGKNKNDKGKRFVEGSIECVAMIDEINFVSGGDTGSICLWNTQKKKPIFTQPLCHGFHEVQSSTEGVVRMPRWITSIACLRYSDIFASGSWEGDVRIWKLDSKLKSFSHIGIVPAPGVVNSLQLLPLQKGALEDALWAAPATQEVSSTVMDTNVKVTGVQSVLMVLGLGQEHRLGRWLTIKGEGITNSTVVIAFHARTRS